MHGSTVRNWHAVVEGFRTRRLMRDAWTHEAHLVVCLWHLLEQDDKAAALCVLRPGIILLNVAMGYENTHEHGYHETITVFWVERVWEFIQKQDSREFGVLADLLVKETRFFDRAFIHQYYPVGVYHSVLARGQYIPPSEGHRICE